MSIEFRENLPLAPLTTLGVGGPARYFTEAASEEDLLSAIGFARERGLEIFILGGGSNLLVSDDGFDGLVVKMAFRGIDVSPPSKGKVTVTSAAGEEWDPLVAMCVDRGLAGFECLSGIPGLVGATPIQNVGAYGQEVSQTIVEVRCIDRQSLEPVPLSNSECGFAYRTSIFNTTHRGRYIVTGVTYELTDGGSPFLEYRDLKERFAGQTPTLAEARRAVLEIRKEKSMVIDPADPNSRSAGSFFKNPIVSRKHAGEIAEAIGETVPYFTMPDGLAKIPAAWLIERAGFSKGYILGNAGISKNHSLAIINRGGASASDMIALKDMIRHAVFSRFEIELVPEPVFLGFGSSGK